VADLIGADPREIVWTSGATESNNLAFKGAAHFYKTRGKHLITVKTEHKAVLDTMRELERQGFEVTYLDVQEDGLLDLDQVQGGHPSDTILASVMFVNNEIGVIQDIAAIGAICREKGVIFHVDAAQATGRWTSTWPAAGGPDEPDLAQDLRPQGHWRAVCAAQAARAHGGPDARWRP
jgi:cysteine desulfurase